MIDLIMGLFGGQVGAIIAGVIGIAAVFFGLKSKVQKSTIAKQDKIITSQAIDKVVLLSAISTNEDSMKRMEEANEILATNDNRDVVLARMRERAAARDNSGEG